MGLPTFGAGVFLGFWGKRLHYLCSKKIILTLFFPVGRPGRMCLVSGDAI